MSSFTTVNVKNGTQYHIALHLNGVAVEVDASSVGLAVLPSNPTISAHMWIGNLANRTMQLDRTDCFLHYQLTVIQTPGSSMLSIKWFPLAHDPGADVVILAEELVHSFKRRLADISRLQERWHELVGFIDYDASALTELSSFELPSDSLYMQSGEDQKVSERLERLLAPHPKLLLTPLLSSLDLRLTDFAEWDGELSRTPSLSDSDSPLQEEFNAMPQAFLQSNWAPGVPFADVHISSHTVSPPQPSLWSFHRRMPSPLSYLPKIVDVFRGRHSRTLSWSDGSGLSGSADASSDTESLGVSSERKSCQGIRDLCVEEADV